MLSDLVSRPPAAPRHLSLAHLAMTTCLPDAHSAGRSQELAEQCRPGPPGQESELGHRAAGFPGQEPNAREADRQEPHKDVERWRRERGT
jgi:hypothetical protein